MPPRRLQRALVEVAVIAAALALVALAWVADLRWFERHVLVAYCATSRTGEVLPAVTRGAALLLAALLVLVVRPRLGRRAARASPGELVAVVAAIAAALLAADLLLRLHPSEEPTPLGRRDGLRAVPDDRLAWRLVPSQTVLAQVHGRTVEYAIDADGNRAARADATIDPELPTIILAGESMAFGESLSYGDTLAANLERDLGVQVMNVAVPGYGNDQAYLRVVDALARLRRPIAVISITLPLQIRRNARTWRPHLELRGGELVPLPGGGPPGIARLWRDEPYHDDAPLALTRAIIAATAAAARARGAREIFVVTGYGPGCRDEDAWVVRELFGNGAITAIPVELHPDEVIGVSGDLHPNALGARKLANRIQRALMRQ